MKYVIALKARSLSKTDLPKNVQKKIAELEKANTAIQDLNWNEQDLNEEEKEDLKAAKQNIADLDDYVVRKIEIFDPEKYAKKLLVVAGMTERKNAAAGKQVVAPKKVVPEKVEPEVVQPEENLSKEVVANENGNISATNTNEPEPEDRHLENLHMLDDKQMQFLDTQEPELEATPKEPQIYEPEEVDEFEKVGDAKPKKMSTGLILMGVGAFFLTWGAVNFFKERRG